MADATTNESGIDLRGYLDILRRRKLIIIISVCVTVGASLVVSFLTTPVYQAEARLLIEPSNSNQIFSQNSGSSSFDAQRETATATEELQAGPVQDKVRQNLGKVPSIKASVVDLTNVVSIKARSTSRATAAAIANAYANSYVEVRRSQDLNDNLAASAQLRTQIDDLEREIAGLAPGAQRDALISTQAAFKQQLDQLQVRASLDTGNARIVSPATKPVTPVEPRKTRSALLAFVLGLILGIGVAFAVEHFDDSLNGMEDLERATGHVAPVIALIPAFGRSKTRSGSVVTLSRRTSPAAEAYRSLRTSVQFMGLDAPLRVIQVTSPNPLEGKTTTVANLGVAIAGTGTRVAIVDLDLRRPRLHEVFELDNNRGFTTVLLGRVSLDDALQPIAGTPVGGVAAVLPAGPVPPNPSELLSSPRVRKLLDELAERVDLVLLDTPPVLPVTDALVVSRCADALILVTSAEVSTRRSVQRAVELLQQVGAPVRGIVMNGAGEREFYGYGYGGRYGYGYPHGYGTGIGPDDDQAPVGKRVKRSKAKAKAKADAKDEALR
jgi:capsular exopolysaccharide synthesis family protein